MFQWVVKAIRRATTLQLSPAATTKRYSRLRMPWPLRTNHFKWNRGWKITVFCVDAAAYTCSAPIYQQRLLSMREVTMWETTSSKP